ncbi:YhgE/Pip domain-containing protein [Gorillibacterium massiliense]|uniref:YhgE/Pip domain-containing protein n=1 Tax=Gorillibacterium massiliense TaxID=1280390 RepID=UPI0004B55BFF|nr:ABC transporter permease [Gorillibacterium massiliense]
MFGINKKSLLLPPIVALVIAFIFSLVLIPSAKQTPKQLPLAIVNEDQGAIGKTMVETIEKTSQATTGDSKPVVKWIAVSTTEEAIAGMNNQKYYGALVLPKDFSEKQASLKTASPSQPEIVIYVNQGKNALAANTVTQMLNGMVDGMNKTVSQQLLAGLKQQGATLTADQAALLASPILKTVNPVNQTGKLANAPASLFQPLWMASLVAAAIMWMNVRKTEASTKKKSLNHKGIQILAGAVAALVTGFGLTWFAEGILGFDFPSFSDTAIFLSIASFSFFSIIRAVLEWLGFAALPVFALVLFFGGPLLAMAPEIMPAFYKDWIYGWLPMRFMVDGLRELFFFGKGLSWSQPTAVLVWIAIGSIAVFALSVFKPKAKAAADKPVAVSAE